ncbi:GNAT family N-acetyltransferase [Acidisphaera sp. S103]|uniref:GNAT family N-acetyltransferase n=1 Tax=Acidisphaera sp. S103 TaxID=1747223 RepID=UPI001C20500E|nr:GNAT family N-acetyltransferase [Acidisphaera sp. S103]
MVGAISVRPSRDGDLEAIAAIYSHHVLHGSASFETDPPSMEEMARRRSDLLRHDFPYLVAEEGGVLCGYAYAGFYRPRVAYRNTVENSVYLRPDAIGRGIGKRLLMALVAACEARGFRQMVAVVGDSANIGSIRLHERCGFRRVGVLQSIGHKHGRWLDTVLFQLTLGAGDSSPPGHPED